MEEASIFYYYFSDPRFERYWNACNRDKELAHRLYEANSRLSNEFRILIVDYLEVFIRNALNQKIASHLEESQWLLIKYEQLRGVNNKYLIKDIKKRYHAKERALSQDALVAELNFGFWVSLFHGKNYGVLKGRPIQIFTNRTMGFDRGQVSNHLFSIRNFRNRITHGEPIVFEREQARISLYQAKCIYKKIYKLLDWLCPHLTPIVRQREQVLAIIAEIELEFRRVSVT